MQLPDDVKNAAREAAETVFGKTASLYKAIDAALFAIEDHPQMQEHHEADVTQKNVFD